MLIKYALKKSKVFEWQTETIFKQTVKDSHHETFCIKKRKVMCLDYS